MEDTTADRYREWCEAQKEYKKLVLMKAENKRLFQKQCSFGEGE